MKVHELISELRNFEANAEVHFSYKSGDYWKTIVAPVIETVDEMQVKYSGYHTMPVLVSEEDQDDNGEFVVMLGA